MSLPPLPRLLTKVVTLIFVLNKWRIVLLKPVGVNTLAVFYCRRRIFYKVLDYVNDNHYHLYVDVKYCLNKGYIMKKQLINQTRIVQQAVLAGNAECKVLYNSAKDMVELEVGGTSLRIAATSFFMMHEMMRKAAAKLVMQTELNTQSQQAVVQQDAYLMQDSHLLAQLQVA
jgi:hypothetical protein